MSILRGLGSRSLQCGCLVGVYETYQGRTVLIVDRRGASCENGDHRNGHALTERPDAGRVPASQPSGQRPAA